MRHLALVDDARERASSARERALARGATEELVLAELGGARRALEEITGRRTPDDLLAAYLREVLYREVRVRRAVAAVEPSEPDRCSR